jgi:hypothetical protein
VAAAWSADRRSPVPPAPGVYLPGQLAAVAPPASGHGRTTYPAEVCPSAAGSGTHLERGLGRRTTPQAGPGSPCVSRASSRRCHHARVNEWPFGDPPDTLVFTTQPVLDGAPVRDVHHDRPSRPKRGEPAIAGAPRNGSRGRRVVASLVSTCCSPGTLSGLRFPTAASIPCVARTTGAARPLQLVGSGGRGGRPCLALDGAAADHRGHSAGCGLPGGSPSLGVSLSRRGEATGASVRLSGRETSPAAQAAAGPWSHRSGPNRRRDGEPDPRRE